MQVASGVDGHFFSSPKRAANGCQQRSRPVTRKVPNDLRVRSNQGSLRLGPLRVTRKGSEVRVLYGPLGKPKSQRCNAPLRRSMSGWSRRRPLLVAQTRDLNAPEVSSPCPRVARATRTTPTGGAQVRPPALTLRAVVGKIPRNTCRSGAPERGANPTSSERQCAPCCGPRDGHIVKQVRCGGAAPSVRMRPWTYRHPSSFVKAPTGSMIP